MANPLVRCEERWHWQDLDPEAWVARLLRSDLYRRETLLERAVLTT